MAHQFPGKLHLFCVGMILFYNAGRMKLGLAARFALVAVSGAAMFTSNRWFSNASVPAVIAYDVLLGTFVYSAAFTLPFVRVRRDISYGVYVLHFPICQMLLLYGLGERFPAAVLLGAVLVLTTLGAYVSARLLEEKAVHLGRRLSRREKV